MDFILCVIFDTIFITELLMVKQSKCNALERCSTIFEISFSFFLLSVTYFCHRWGCPRVGKFCKMRFMDLNEGCSRDCARFTLCSVPAESFGQTTEGVVVRF
jgi:hypothetical protein